ncbi:MAG: hypothetical protein J1E16_02590 [Muribaculaceae bacterium]|nr:hypothetical protein [Muribaculaceae bacterium]
MKKSQILHLKTLVLIFMLIFISSCDDDVVGNWEPMEWVYENVSDGIKIIEPSGKDKDHVKYSTKIEVSKSGSVDIVCKNYNSYWFAEYPNMTNEGDYQSRFNTDFCEMKIEGNTLHCEFFNIEQQNPENFQIVLTAGDIFYHFQIEIK